MPFITLRDPTSTQIERDAPSTVERSMVRSGGARGQAVRKRETNSIDPEQVKCKELLYY